MNYPFGLRIAVHVPPGNGEAPEHTRSTRDCDLEIDLSPSATRAFEQQAGFRRYTSEETSTDGRPSLFVDEIGAERSLRMTYADGTIFVVDRSGQRVHGSWKPASSLGDTLVYLYGPVMGLVMYLRGKACLHGAAVVIDGRAAVFIGPPEAGKSTLAAAFARRRLPVLTDDIAVLDRIGTSYVVQPSVPRILLWPESVEALWGESAALPLMVPGWDKRHLDLAAMGVDRTAAPVAAIYVLADRKASGRIGMSALSGTSALMELIGNRYFTRFMDPVIQARHLSIFTDLLAQARVVRLFRPDDLGLLNDLCDAVIQDFATHASNAAAREDARV